MIGRAYDLELESLGSNAGSAPHRPHDQSTHCKARD
jgi:hypothetical protein